jgi:hypothetical protein
MSRVPQRKKEKEQAKEKEGEILNSAEIFFINYY